MKIALYYNHYETLGHTTRALTLAYSLSKENKVMVLQGGEQQRYYNNEISVINIPHPYCGKDWFRGKRRPVDLDNIKRRVNFMKKRILDFKPDILVVEFFPFGREIVKFEIIPVINWIKKTFPKIKIVSSVGYPIFSYSYKKVLAYSAYFDKILIHCPEELDYRTICSMMEKYKSDNYRVYKEVFEKLHNKVVFTGYLIPLYKHKNKDIKKELGIEDKKMVLASRGGGTVYPQIILRSILANAYLPEDYAVVAVGGPSSTKAEMNLFNLAAKKAGSRLIVKKYVHDFLDYMRCCDVSVSMSGYNTSIQALYFRKKSILIPKTYNFRGGDIEQIYRAKMLSEIIGAEVLDYNSSSPKQIASTILRLMEQPTLKYHVEEHWFKGDVNSAKCLFGLHQGN